MKLLITFYSVSFAILLEKELKSLKVSCRVIPVPRSVSSSCGYAVVVPGMRPEELWEVLEGAGIEWEGIYQVEDSKGNEYFRQLQINK